jgi:hypothetical protein
MKYKEEIDILLQTHGKIMFYLKITTQQQQHSSLSIVFCFLFFCFFCVCVYIYIYIYLKYCLEMWCKPHSKITFFVKK